MLLRLLLATMLLLTPGAACAAKVGEPAPPFTLTTFDGEIVTSESLRGKVVVLNYWATWCGPCRVELPELDTYKRRRRGADLAVFAIEISGMRRGKLTPLASVLSFPMVSKLKGKGYGTIKGAVPTNYVIDKAGVVRYARAGAFNSAALEALVTPLLAHPVPQVATATSP